MTDSGYSRRSVQRRGSHFPWRRKSLRRFLPALVLCVCVTNGLSAEDGVEFNGRTSYAAVTYPDNAFGRQQLTVAAWVRMRRVDGSQVFVARGEAPRFFTFYLHKGKVRMLIEYREGQYAHADASPPPVDQWTHYAGTYDGAKIRIFLNGRLQQEVEASGRIPAGKAKLYIGALKPGQRVLDGRLDDVALWRRVLSDNEIHELAARRGAPLPPEGLVGGWLGSTLHGNTWSNVATSGPDARYEPDPDFRPPTVDGYRGIWYSNTPQENKYKYKYSGGLGTYCAKHRPFAVYSRAANKTFFCYGGTTEENDTLLHMVSYFDHATGTVPRPVTLLDKRTTDAHDNPVITIDRDGYIWIFSSSHGTARPSYISKSSKPLDISAFRRIVTTNFSYPQSYFIAGKGFFFLHTRYGGGRRLYQMTSPDGVAWSKPRLLAAIDMGHYQISRAAGNRVTSAFNYHPNGKGLDWRTNLYCMQTTDFGQTWHTVDGKPISLPLTKPDNPARIHDYQKDGLNVYLKDVAYDSAGNPVILFLTSLGWQSGPENCPRVWRTARWTGRRWEILGSIQSNNNYDMGSLYIERDDLWRIIGPTEPGPQRFNTGGEVAMWISIDQGRCWFKVKQLTRNSQYNHTYCRKPINAHPDFYCLWADGDGRRPSDSRLYFCDIQGNVYRLPVHMKGPTARPEPVR